MLESPTDHRPLKGYGLHMPRTRSQHRRVQRRGPRGYEYWYTDYLDAEDEHGHRAHKTKDFGLCSAVGRAEAQAACDRFLEGVNGRKGGGASMTVAAFWKDIYFPARSSHWSYNTRAAMESAWRSHIESALGKMRLDSVVKHHVEHALAKAAQAGAGQSTLNAVTFVARDLFEEAVDNEFIARNPARKIRAPKGKPGKQPRSMTEAEVTRLLTVTDGDERLMWAVMLLCGARPSEMLALTRADIVPAGLLIERQSLRGENSPTKNRKKRIAPLAAQLRADLLAHIEAMPATQTLLFPDVNGAMRHLKQDRVRGILTRARKAAGIPDLTWRMCRTTFATLFDGDVADVSAILDHATPEFTQRVYRRAQQERAQRSVDKLAARVVPIRKGA